MDGVDGDLDTWMELTAITAQSRTSGHATHFFVIGLHLVVLPKNGDPNRAVLAACTEAELIKIAAKQYCDTGPYTTRLSSINPPQLNSCFWCQC